MTSGALDKAALERLRQLNQDGQPDLVREVLAVFLSDAPRRLRAIDDALSQGGTVDAHRAAHALKGAAGTIGALTLTHLCRELESAAKAGALDRAGDAARRLHAEVARVRAEIEGILGG